MPAITKLALYKRSMYKYNPQRSEDKVLRDIEATKRLYKFCLANAENAVIYTEMGAQVAFILPVRDFQRIIEDKGVQDLFCDLVMEGFWQTEVDDRLHQDMINHLSSCDFIVFTFHKEKNKGNWHYDRLGSFLTYEVLDRRLILYFGGIMVYPDLQNHHYGTALMRLVANREGTPYLALRTQNPQMYSSFRHICQEVYPNGKPPEKEIKEIGKRVAELLKMKRYDPDTMTEKGTYGHSLYGKPIEAKGAAIEAFKRINIQNGDSIIAVGKRERYYT